jgi:hypothetical protein
MSKKLLINYNTPDTLQLKEKVQNQFLLEYERAAGDPANE